MLCSRNNVSQEKAWLVARGFEENMNSFEKQSPATSKDSLHGILATISSKKWPRKAIDLKTPFLQGDEKLTRKVYLTPTSEAHIPHSHVWLLKKCVYSLTDTSLIWYKKVQKFKWCHMCTCRWFLKFFFNHIIFKLRQTFSFGKEKNDCFRYLGLNILTD